MALQSPLPQSIQIYQLRPIDYNYFSVFQKFPLTFLVIGGIIGAPQALRHILPQ